MSQAINIFVWYLVGTFVGVIALPLVFRFFPSLPSRGFALARPLGLLIWGFTFWLLASFGVLQNDLGGQVLAALVFLAFSLMQMKGTRKEALLTWLRQNLRTVLTIEGLFLFVFLVWVLVRGMNPEVTYTEKPMELAFINSILRSTSFPPQDPWLSGYAISYYYFGYVMVAMLTRFSGVAAATAFNLANASWLAMTAVALYGIVFDLSLASARNSYHQTVKEVENFARRAGFLGPLFVLLMSTYEGVLEILHAGGLFWKVDPQGQLSSRFWNWLSILDLNQPPPQPFDWIPSRGGGWLWWRGSRVLQDLSLSGQHIEVIDEFPFFSYLLADLHPHVLAMPFTLLAIALAMNLFFDGETYLQQSRRLLDWARNKNFWLTALVLGSLAFINTWDFPIYVGLFCLVWSFKAYRASGWKPGLLAEFLKNGLVLGVAGVVLYLPFYFGFGSQAGGVLPSLEFMTRGIHFWVLFAVLLVPISAFCLYQAKRKLGWSDFWKGARFTLVLFSVLFFLMVFYGALLLSFQAWGAGLSASSNPYLSALGVKMTQGGAAFAGVHAGYPAGEILKASLLRRLQAPGTWLTLAALLTITLSVLLKRKTAQSVEISAEGEHLRITNGAEELIYFLVLFGLLLTIIPEFFYLRDQFGTRMNTIFKFYFQAWVFWGIAAASGSAVLFRQLRGWRGSVFQILWILVVAGGLFYPVIMLTDKTNSFSMKGWTLDGNAYIQKFNPEEYAAIGWLQDAPMGVVVEAVGGSYTDYARISTRTGLPTLLGWPGHESQWRGGGEEMGSRFADIQQLYETTDWNEAWRTLRDYNVRYVYIGSLERSTYRVSPSKFDSHLPLVFSNNSTRIYEVTTLSGEVQP
jgi:YYY domain-containing protein